MKKIKAFTLGELLVVLVVSSIAITISFLALENVQKQLKSIQGVFETQQQINHLERSITTDLNRYTAVYNASKNNIVFKDGNKTIQYQIRKDYILRNKDTIALSPKEITCYLNGKQVKNGTIDALEFSFSKTYSQNGFFSYKIKDAAHYMNKNNTNGF
tara:strand:+ start:5645 stop:6118 length:474 start_codon:yes stop_codon:yes gene_type:complete